MSRMFLKSAVEVGVGCLFGGSIRTGCSEVLLNPTVLHKGKVTSFVIISLAGKEQYMLGYSTVKDVLFCCFDFVFFNC